MRWLFPVGEISVEERKRIYLCLFNILFYNFTHIYLSKDLPSNWKLFIDLLFKKKETDAIPMVKEITIRISLKWWFFKGFAGKRIFVTRDHFCNCGIGIALKNQFYIRHPNQLLAPPCYLYGNRFWHSHRLKRGFQILEDGCWNWYAPSILSTRLHSVSGMSSFLVSFVLLAHSGIKNRDAEYMIFGTYFS